MEHTPAKDRVSPTDWEACELIALNTAARLTPDASTDPLQRAVLIAAREGAREVAAAIRAAFAPHTQATGRRRAS